MGLFFNSTARAVFKGGTLIPAGETREIPDHLMPEYVVPVTATAPPPVVEFDAKALVALGVTEFKSQLEKLTQGNGLSRAQLQAAKRLEEQADKPRKSVIDALDFSLLALEI